MEGKLKILIVEDSEEDLELVIRELTRSGIRFEFLVVDKKVDFENALTEFSPEIIISDHSLPQFSSSEALKISKAHSRHTGKAIPFILVTGSVSEEFAVQIIKSGADDYILKDRLKRLPSAIRNALEKWNVENEMTRAQIEKKEVFDILQKSLNEIYIFNGDTLLYEYVNEGGLKNLGYTKQEIARLTPLDIQPQFTERSFKDLLAGVEDNFSQKKIFETQHRRKDGTIYSAEVHLQPVMRGAQQSFLAIVSDITEIKKYLSKLEVQNEKLRDIAWVQSHEVRAPLSRIMGLVMLVTRKNGSVDLKEVLGHLLTSAQELDDVVKRIVRETENH